VLQILIGALPEIARAVAEPLSKTDRITLVSTGGEGTGASRITGDVAKIVAELPPLIESALRRRSAAPDRGDPGAQEGVGKTGDEVIRPRLRA